MKNLVKSQYRMFFSNGRLFLAFAASLIIPFVQLGYHFSRCGQNTMFYLQKCQESCQWIMLTNLFISFEYIYRMKNSGISEVLCVLKNGMVKTYGIAVSVLLSLVFVQGIPFFAYPVISALQSGKFAALIFHIFLAVALNVILLGFACVSLGAFTALLCRRTAAYSLMSVILFLALPASELLPGILYDQYGIDLWKIWGIFSGLLPPAQGWSVDYQYGIPLEKYRWCLLLLWFFLLLGLYFFHLVKGKKRRGLLLGGTVALIAAFCIRGYWFQGSHLDLTACPTGTIRADQQYYNTHSSQEKDAGFKVTAYEMDISIHQELKSQLRVYLENESSTNELQFTLYHSFEIDKIRDDRNVSLPFERSGDYFSVTCEEFPDYLDISYKGSSNLFYSNHQGVCLPGSFPYFPWAGYKKIHYLSPEPQDNLAQFVFRDGNCSSRFSVTIEGGKNIVTNLPKNAEGVYEGESSSFTIMGGFLEECEQGGYSFVKCTSCPEDRVLNEKYLSILQAELDFRKEANEKIDLKKFKFFQMPEAMSNRSYFTGLAVLENHIFLMPGGDPSADAEELLFQIRNGPILDINEYEKHWGLQ